MKRFFFSLIALAAAAASCTQSALVETPDMNGTEITFNPYTGRTPVTRATDIVKATGLANAGGFQVIGFIKQGDNESLYMEKAVTGTPTGVDDAVNWNYYGNLFWPDAESESTLSFVAYSTNALGDYTLADGTSANLITWTTENKEFTFTVPNKVSEQIDLLATNYQTNLSLDTNAGGTVDLEFGHLLTKVGFKAQPTRVNDNLIIKISSLALSGTMPTQGKLNLLDAVNDRGQNKTVRPTWSSKTTPVAPVDPENPDAPEGNLKTTYQMVEGSTPLEVECAAEAVRLAEAGNPFMMIMPNECPDAEIQITYQLVSEDRGESQVMNAIVPLGTFNFEQGTAYEFVLKISTSSIGFDVVETDWNTAGESEGIKPEYPIYPERAENIDYGVNVKSETEATAAVYVNENLYKSIAVEFKPANANDEDWTGSTTIPVEAYDTPYEIGGPYNVDLKVNQNDLTPNTEYRYRIIATTEEDDDVIFDEQKKSFITLAVIDTPSYTELTSFSVKLNASWNNQNGSAVPSKLGFCYLEGEGDEVKPTTRLFKGKSTNATIEDFSSVFDGLTPNTTYTFRPYCINAQGGVAYGDKIVITTTIGLEIPDPDGGEDDGGDTPGTGDDDKDEPIDPWEEPKDDDNDGYDDNTGLPIEPDFDFE